MALQFEIIKIISTNSYMAPNMAAFNEDFGHITTIQTFKGNPKLKLACVDAILSDSHQSL